MLFQLIHHRSIAKLTAFTIIALAAINTAFAKPNVDTATPTTQTVPTTEPADVNAKHLTRQAEVALEQIAAVLDANPPALTIPPARAMALTLFDAILQDPNVDHRPAVGEFRVARTKQAIKEMLATHVTDDSVVIWQIYNMGFVVRTKSVTLGFDLIKLSHVPELALDDATTQSLIDQCDVLFISHVHLDHADQDVANRFLAAGKPVPGPDSMWRGDPIYDRLTHIPRDGMAAGHPLAVCAGKASLNVTIYPGYQRINDGTLRGTFVDDNVYIITTPEGIRIAHTGDNNIPEGLPPTPTPVDVLLMKLDPETLKSKDIVHAFAPRLVVPSHFEELGHINPGSRQPYWLGMDRVTHLDVPSVIMAWGDRYRYTRNAEAPAK